MERFDGKNFYIKFSTGATRQLYDALIKIAQRGEVTGADTVVCFLEKQKHSGPEGANGFALYPPPLELANSDHMKVFGDLLWKLASHLCCESPDKTLCDLDWDSDLRHLWLRVVVDLYTIAVENLPESKSTLYSVADLPLSNFDRSQLEFDRLMWRKCVLVRETRTEQEPRGSIIKLEPSISQPMVKELIDRCERLPENDWSRYHLVTLNEELSEIFLAMNDYEAAAIALRSAASYSKDCEYQRALLEYADELVKY